MGYSHFRFKKRTCISLLLAYPDIVNKRKNKGFDFADIEQRDVDKVVRLINNMPRKRLSSISNALHKAQLAQIYIRQAQQPSRIPIPKYRDLCAQEYPICRRK